MTEEKHTLIKALAQMKTLEIEIARLKTKQRRLYRIVFDAIDKMVKNDNISNGA